jgi:hypothetical protein
MGAVDLRTPICGGWSTDRMEVRLDKGHGPGEWWRVDYKGG